MQRCSNRQHGCRQCARSLLGAILSSELSQHCEATRPRYVVDGETADAVRKHCRFVIATTKPLLDRLNHTAVIVPSWFDLAVEATQPAIKVQRLARCAGRSRSEQSAMSNESTWASATSAAASKARSEIPPRV